MNENLICQADEFCGNQAEHTIYDRNIDKVVTVCEWHVEKIKQSNCSEYSCYCPNCGCIVPVN